MYVCLCVCLMFKICACCVCVLFGVHVHICVQRRCIHVCVCCVIVSSCWWSTVHVGQTSHSESKTFNLEVVGQVCPSSLPGALT